jgi:membrane-associated protease RseP (regulator of RpoE activity)
MRNSLLMLPLILLLAACAPKSLPPIVQGGVVDQEAKRQQEIVLKDYLDRLARVSRVEHRVLTRNMVDCPDSMFLSGLVVLDESEIHTPYREAAKTILGLGPAARIMSVDPGAAAAKRGLREGDIITEINGQKATGAAWANRQLRKQRKVLLKVSRNAETLDVEMWQDRACESPVTVKEEPSINAFAFGSKIWVTSGMVKFCKNDHELGLVIGHELAHNSMSHLKAKMGNGLLFSFLIDGPIIALTGVNPGIGRNIGEGLHSQDFETEADYIGLYYTARAGYEIDGVADLWRRMAVEHPDAIYTATTHPTTANRFVVLEAAAKEIEAKRAKGQELVPEMKPAQ